MSDLLLYGVVGDEIDALSTVAAIKALGPKKAKIRLNTPGGGVWDGNAIAEAVKEHGGIDTHVDALAASMGSVIFLAGNRRTMSPRSRLMIHNPASMVFGDAKTMRKEADVLEGVEVDFAKMYSDASGGKISPEEAQALMDEETWLGPEEAVALGFAHAITGNATACVTIPASMQYRNIPKGLVTMSTGTQEAKPSLLDRLVARITVDTTAVQAELSEASAALADAVAKLADAEGRATAADARANEAVATLEAERTAHTAALAEAVAAAKIEGAQEFAAQNLKASAPEGLPHVEEGMETFTTHSAKWDELRAAGKYEQAGEYYSKHKNSILRGE